MRRPCQPSALLSSPPEARAGCSPAHQLPLFTPQVAAAPGTSGLTADIERLLRDDAEFCGVALLPRARIPSTSIPLSKPASGVRGAVVGASLLAL